MSDSSTTTPLRRDVVGRSIAATVRRRICRSRERFWRAEDFESESRGAVLRVLSRLAHEGELRHVRHGLYWRGRQTLLGMSPPSTEALLGAIVGDVGVGPASASAALALGLSAQHPRRDIVAVPGRVPRSMPENVDVRTRQGRRGRVMERLSWCEVGMLEVLDEWAGVIDMPREEAVEELLRWLSSGRVRPDRLARAGRSEPARVREGLRGLLVRAGFPKEAELVPLALTPGVRDRALVVA